MAEYITSGSVKVFPSSLRSGAYSQGKFTTESNLTNFLRSVTDQKSFSIADPNATPATESNPHYNANYYQFIINGFYFEVDKNALSTYVSNPLYASIQVDSDGKLIAWNGGTVLDDSTNCLAIKFTNEIPSATAGATAYSLDIKATKRFAKFNADAMFIVQDDSAGTITDLTTVLKNKEDKFGASHKLSLAETDNLVSGTLPVSHGGTGTTNLDSINVGGAQTMVDANHEELSVPNVLNSHQPIKFWQGVPVAIPAVEAAERLSKYNAEQASAINEGGVQQDGTYQATYFANGVPVAIASGSTVDAFSKGLKDGCGGKDTDTASHMTYQSVYFNKPEGTQGATATAGITIHISTASPVETQATGQTGDIWFRYNPN